VIRVLKKSEASNWLVMIILLLLLLPYLYLSFFIHPSADDYNYAWLTISKSYFQEYVNQYLTWNGRYSSNFLALSNPIAFGQLNLYRLIPVLLIFFTVLGLLFLFSSMSIRQISIVKKINFSLAITAFYLFVMPQIAEGIYWYTAAVTYHLSLIFFSVYIGLFQRYMQKNYLINKLFNVLFLIFLLLIIPGFNEIMMIVLLLFHLIFLLYTVYIQRKITLFPVILLLLAVASAIIIIAAPGNNTRLSFFENKYQLGHSIMMSIFQTARFLFDWISNLPFILLSLLYLIIIYSHIRHVNTNNDNILIKKIFLIGLACPGVIFLSVFPAYWSTGILGQHRTLNSACFLFILIWLYFLQHLVIFLKNNNRFENMISLFGLKSKTFIFIIAITAMLVTKNGYHACTDIIYKKAILFNKEMTERNNIIIQGKRNAIVNIILKPIQHKPATIFVLDITKDSTHWINTGFASFYHLKSVKIEN